MCAAINNEDIYLEMLEIACNLLAENEICTYCRAKMYGDCNGIVGFDTCGGEIFEGLLIQAKREIAKRKEIA